MIDPENWAFSLDEELSATIPFKGDSTTQLIKSAAIPATEGEVLGETKV